jgi:thioredoxin 1
MVESATELSEKEFSSFIKKGIVLIDFFAEWCMPCVMMAPILEDVAKELKNKIKIGKINVSDHQALAGKYDVSSIPNLILFRDGKQIDQFIGAMSEDELVEKLKKHIK